MDGTRTHIHMILDRTGSMEPIRDDTIGGVNAFIAAQKAQPGDVTMTLVQFDSQAPYEKLYHFLPIDQAPPLTRETYVPRAGTPLLDALGLGMVDLHEALARTAAERRPGSVIFAVVTDGEENASREYTRKQVMEMVAQRREKDGWQFAFLSADLGAVQEAQDLGVLADGVMAYDRDGAGVGAAFSSLSAAVSRRRQAPSDPIGFTEEERGAQQTETERRRRK